MKDDKFETIEEFYKEFEINGCEYAFDYNGMEYQICHNDDDDGFNISECNGSGKWWSYGSFDEMLDNFKADDGKCMRDFILDVEGAF